MIIFTILGVIVAGMAAIAGLSIGIAMIANKLRLLDDLEKDYEDDY